MRISDEEITILKNTFAENDVLLKSVRKAMLGLPMVTDEDKYLADLFKSEDLRKVMRRIFLPEIEGDTPLGQNLDLWMTVQFADKTPEFSDVLLQARELLIELIEAGLKDLEAPRANDRITFKRTQDPEADYVHLTARNTLINHVDQQLLTIKALAGKKEESVEQTKTRLLKDSTK